MTYSVQCTCTGVRKLLVGCMYVFQFVCVFKLDTLYTVYNHVLHVSYCGMYDE